MIMTLRPGAQPGEIFTPEDYQPYFIKIVQDDFATAKRAPIGKALDPRGCRSRP